ncbi:MAG: serine/threonine-protein kinase [Myxococcota bacterium]
MLIPLHPTTPMTYPGAVSLVGRKLGPYKIIGELGSGGMAVVYKAEQPALNRMVAIKELRKELSGDDSIAQRFEREARSIASLAHQNIVHVYDFLERASSSFIVMEYVDGIDLADLLRRVERLPGDIAAIVALQTIRALEYAHFHGVIHRDLKPANLMITKQGDIKLMDFGIARDESEEDLTLPGQALGTPAYMSPEQVMGDRVTFHSDIFSFGILLYQMLTGKKPFIDDENVGVMNKIVNAPYKRPRALCPDIPSKLQRITRRCLQKEPEDRYKSTEDLRLDLEAFVATRVRINHNGRLVIFLRHRGLITDGEAATYVRQEQLHSPSTARIDQGHLSPWNVVLRPSLLLNLSMIAVLALWIYFVQWFPLGNAIEPTHPSLTNTGSLENGPSKTAGNSNRSQGK